MGFAQLVVYESGRRWIDTLRARLTSLGVRVRHTTSAADSLELLHEEPRSMLVVELGVEPLVALRLIEAACHFEGGVPVFVLAGAGQTEWELPAREAGADAFLVEPMTPGELADLVERVARRLIGQPGAVRTGLVAVRSPG